MEENSNIVAGVGDEVVLFILFLVISTILIFYLSRRRGRRIEEVNQAEINDDHVTENENHGELHDHHVNENQNVRQRNVFQEEIITVRLVTLQTTQTVTISSNTSLDEIQRLYFTTEYNERRRIRFIYQGRVISDTNTTLSENNISNNSSIHVHIGEHSQTTQDTNPDHVEGLVDLSFLFIPLFGLMICVIWISFMIWPSVFSLFTKVMLFILSLGYVYLVFNMQFSS